MIPFRNIIELKRLRVCVCARVSFLLFVYWKEKNYICVKSNTLELFCRLSRNSRRSQFFFFFIVHLLRFSHFFPLKGNFVATTVHRPINNSDGFICVEVNAEVYASNLSGRSVHHREFALIVNPIDRRHENIYSYFVMFSLALSHQFHACSSWMNIFQFIWFVVIISTTSATADHAPLIDCDHWISNNIPKVIMCCRRLNHKMTQRIRLSSDNLAR